MRIASMAVGTGFTVVVTEAGAVYSFGVADGRLGNGGSDQDERVFLPKRIEALDGMHVTTVAAGNWHALALTVCGRMYSWGISGDGNIEPELGLRNDSNDHRNHSFCSVSRLIAALRDKRVQAIAAGPDASCAVADAGALYTLGPK